MPRNIYQNKLDKAYFQNDTAYGDFKDLTRRTQLLIKYYMIKHLILLKIHNSMHINVDLLQWFINFLIKKYLMEQLLKMNLYLINNLQNNCTKQLLENFTTKKYLPFLDIWGADLADIQLISKFNKGFRFILGVINIYSKHA